MNIKSKINTNKKGSYILESVIVMPIFIISIVVMTSIILLYISIEDSSFIMAREMRYAAIKGYFFDKDFELPLIIKKDIRSNNKMISDVLISEYGYKVDRLTNDEMIILSMIINFDVKNPLKLASKSKYELALATRAYVGKEGDIEPLDEEGFMRNDEEVYIFPKSGKKYHNINCTYMKAAAYPQSLNRTIRKKYGSCPICNSKKAELGSLVYVFPRYGENYHLPGCDVLERHYIIISRKTAEKRGYDQCSKCGG